MLMLYIFLQIKYINRYVLVIHKEIPVSKTSTPYSHILIIDTGKLPVPATVIMDHLYGDRAVRSMEFTICAGRDLAHQPDKHPLDIIMPQVDTELNRHSRIQAIFIIGEFADDEFEALRAGIAQRSGLPTEIIHTSEITD